MAHCFFCNNELTNREETSKICVQFPDKVAVVESDDTMFCENCNDFYLTTDQFISSLQQMKQSFDKSAKTIEKGVYN